MTTFTIIVCMTIAAYAGGRVLHVVLENTVDRFFDKKGRLK